MSAEIVSDPEVLHGQARIAGTRIPVSLVLEAVAAGHDEADCAASTRACLRDQYLRPCGTHPSLLAKRSAHSPPAVEDQAGRESACRGSRSLRPLGHDVDTVIEEVMLGTVDEDVLAAATA